MKQKKISYLDGHIVWETSPLFSVDIQYLTTKPDVKFIRAGYEGEQVRWKIKEDNHPIGEVLL